MPNQEFPFRSILVAIDFSEHAGAALGRAVALAEKTGAAVKAVHVVTGVEWAVAGTSFAGHWRVPPNEIRKAEKRLRQQAEERLTAWLAPFAKQNPELKSEVLVGIAFVEIIRAVRKEKHDLVLAGTRGLSGVGRMLVGSTAERLVRKCPCPVWIVKPQHEWPLRSILAPVDLTAMSGQVLEIAGALGRVARCALTVLHVFNFPSEQIATLPEAIVGLDVRSQRRALRQTAANQLSDFVKRHVPERTKVAQQLGAGSPWQAIVRAADRLDAGLIVMGSVGRTGIPGFLIGNTGEKVLRHCDRSILAVKPEGFVSPVK
jgi:nucleotide-binding universal stress UspA family protein